MVNEGGGLPPVEQVLVPVHHFENREGAVELSVVAAEFDQTSPSRFEELDLLLPRSFVLGEGFLFHSETSEDGEQQCAVVTVS